SDDSATETTAVVTEADLSILKVALDSRIAAGGTVTYEIAVDNAGPSDAADVEITDDIPAEASFVSASLGGTEAGGVVTWNLGSIASGGSVTVELVLRTDASAAGWISNTAIATSSTPDPDGEPPRSTADIRVIGADVVADLAVTKTADVAQVRPGQTIVYTVDVVNRGPVDATGVVIVDDLPAVLTFERAEASAGRFTLASGWELARLEVGERAALTLWTRLREEASAGDLVNVARVLALDQRDPARGNDASTEVLSVFAERNDLASTGLAAGRAVTAALLLLLTAMVLFVTSAKRRDDGTVSRAQDVDATR
ncbi:MAG: DUF11 domain-containing protein, partial [Actinomycetota bacterium]